jgi:uncharacterized protein (TIGR02246 family)
MSRSVVLLAASFLVLASGCAQQAQVDVQAEQAAIRQSAEDWEAAANAKDVDRLVGLYTPDASVFPPNTPVVTGSEAIRTLWSQFVASPGFTSSLQTTKVEISGAGDLAYAAGTYEDTMEDAEGNPVADRGKWMTVSKKQPDGTWKVVADMWNSDGPTPAPAAAAE